MKKLFYTSVFALLLVTLSSFTAQLATSVNQTSVQQTGSFEYFRVHRQGQSGVALSWACSATDVVSFVVEKSYDGDFYDGLTNMRMGAGATYKFVDNSVFPGVIYYRVKAVHADGSEEYSPVDSVRIVKH